MTVCCNQKARKNYSEPIFRLFGGLKIRRDVSEVDLKGANPTAEKMRSHKCFFVRSILGVEMYTGSTGSSRFGKFENF
jgi:hypothetical protein